MKPEERVEESRKDLFSKDKEAVERAEKLLRRGAVTEASKEWVEKEIAAAKEARSKEKDPVEARKLAEKLIPENKREEYAKAKTELVAFERMIDDGKIVSDGSGGWKIAPKAAEPSGTELVVFRAVERGRERQKSDADEKVNHLEFVKDALKDVPDAEGIIPDVKTSLESIKNVRPREGASKEEKLALEATKDRASTAYSVVALASAIPKTFGKERMAKLKGLANPAEAEAMLKEFSADGKTPNPRVVEGAATAAHQESSLVGLSLAALLTPKTPLQAKAEALLKETAGKGVDLVIGDLTTTQGLKDFQTSLKTAAEKVEKDAKDPANAFRKMDLNTQLNQLKALQAIFEKVTPETAQALRKALEKGDAAFTGAFSKYLSTLAEIEKLPPEKRIRRMLDAQKELLKVFEGMKHLDGKTKDALEALVVDALERGDELVAQRATDIVVLRNRAELEKEVRDDLIAKDSKYKDDKEWEKYKKEKAEELEEKVREKGRKRVCKCKILASLSCATGIAPGGKKVPVQETHIK